MDDKWFKAKQKDAGVTAEDIARLLGRDRSAVSHIYTGRRRMSLEWAKAFATALNQPLDEVLKHAGALEEEEQQELRITVHNGDASPIDLRPSQEDTFSIRARSFGGDREGVTAWTVRRPTMLLEGYIPGDTILVDATQSELCRSGDTVLAQAHDWQTGAAVTLLRRYEPPVLVAASAIRADHKVHVVDGSNVVIRGKVIASWRDSARSVRE